MGKGVALPEDRWVRDALKLVDDAGMLFGRRHWIWQMGLLYVIDLDLSLPKFATSLGRQGSSYMYGTAAAMVELWDWLASRGLAQEPGLWLLTRAEQLLKG